MTNEEAENILRKNYQCRTDGYKDCLRIGFSCEECPIYVNDKRLIEAIGIAIEALKKEVSQQPMKSIDTFSKSLYKLYCPTCGNYIACGNSRVGTLNKFTKATDRCGYCGQKIDFER